MDAYLAKPYSAGALLDAIEQALRLNQEVAVPAGEGRGAGPAQGPSAEPSAVTAGGPAQSSPGPVEPALDLEEVMARLDGDRSLLAELAERFQTEAPRMLSEVRRCCEAADAGGLERAAHSLRGCVSVFGASAVADAALALEVMARQGVLAGAGEKLAAVEREIRRLQLGLARLDELGAA